MRSLNSSLPRAASQNRRRQPNSELLQAFKAAALSVTQLYKTAATEDEATQEAHTAGYVEALDDLLAFLDGRNLGLGDGEGWQVRTWATQRHQSLSNTNTTSDHGNVSSEEEEKRTRSISPTIQPKSFPQYRSTSVQTEPTSAEIAQDLPRQNLPRDDMFQFESTTSHHTPAVRLEVVPRPSRAPQQRSSHYSRTSDRMPGFSLGPLGHGAGSKRKAPLHEFFDISAPNGGREGHSPGKRSRMN